MPTLTAEQITDIRLVTGANDTTVISDPLIQTLYDMAYTSAPLTSLVNPYTYVYILRRLWGTQRRKADRTTDYGDRQTRSQVTDNTKALLDYWEGVAGLGDGAGGVLGTLSTGVLAYGLDATDDDLTDVDS